MVYKSYVKNRTISDVKIATQSNEHQNTITQLSLGYRHDQYSKTSFCDPPRFHPFFSTILNFVPILT